MNQSIARFVVRAVFVLALLFGFNSLAYAQVVPPPAPVFDIPQPFVMPGTTEGDGAHFTITDSQYLNITLDSTEQIKLKMDSVPEMVTLAVEQSASSTATSTRVTLSGFAPLTTYYKYEDSYHNLDQFITDADGKYSYTQDLSKPHIVFIQPRHSTKFIKDDATGGDCTAIGTWDNSTKVCTMNVDLTETAQIDSDNVTLDGNGHTITGTNTGNGIYLFERTGVTIKNLNIKDTSSGISLIFSNGNTLINNTASLNSWTGSNGIMLYSSNNNALINNIVSNYSYGIMLSRSSSNILTGNTTNHCGIVIEGSNSNSLSNNTVSSNYNSGIMLVNFSINNTLNWNTISLSSGSYGIFSDGSGNSILNNAVSLVSLNGAYGILLSNGSGNTLTNNSVSLLSSNNSYGIFSGGSNNTLTGNTVSSSLSNYSYGILVGGSNNTLTSNTSLGNYIGVLLGGSNNTLTGNTISNNSSFGIILTGLSDILSNNTVSNNSGIGMYVSSGLSGNQIYNNNFFNNSTQIEVSTYNVNGDVFNLASPIGGNYWSDFDTASEGCSDANNDGFCDAPYVFNGGQDNLPWTRKDGWLGSTTPTTPVVIIPGILGTYLNRESDGEEVWLNWNKLVNTPFSGGDEYDTYLNQLAFAAGTGGQDPTNPILTTGDIIRSVFLGGDYFSSLISALESKGYVENTDLFVFPYDWRLPIEENATLLKAKIEEIKTQTSNAKVDIIAHSMGGLVTTSYMQQFGGDSVRKYIAVGVPTLGAPKAFKILMYGDNLDIGQLNAERMKVISQNIPSLYELLPTPKYFTADSTSPYYVYDMDDLDKNGITGRLDYNQTMDFLKNTGRNSMLVDKVKISEATRDNFVIPTNVDAYNIVGCGQATIGKIFTVNKISPTDLEYDIYPVSGDGTVPLQSSAPVLSEKTYYIKGLHHSTMSSSDEAKSVILPLLSGVLPTGFATSTPSSLAIRCKLSGTQVSFHSPISLNIYDSEGRHTGPTETGDIETQIPGVSYDVIDHNSFAFLPEGGNYTIVGNSTATTTGTFSTRIKKINDSVVESEQYWNDVQLSASSTVKIAVSDAVTQIPIQMDFAGDGLYETNIEPSAILTQAQAVDITKPVTATGVQGSVGFNNWFTSAPVVSLDATDDLSGILKTEYSLDSGTTWNNYTTPFSISMEGIITLSYRSVDKAGNREDVKSEVMYIDTTAPTIFASDISAEQLTVEGTLLTVPVTVEDSIDPNPTFTTDVPLTQVFASGVTPISITAQDQAGNIATSTITVTIYSSPEADPDGDGVPNQDDVKPFDATVFANLTIPAEYALWEKESFDLPFGVAGKGEVNLLLSNTYYRVGASPVKDSVGATVPATVTTTDGVITVLFTQGTKELKTYTLTLTTKKGNSKERESIKYKKDHETDEVKKHDLEKEFDFASAPITLSITNTTANISTSEISTVTIYDKQQTAQLQYKYKDNDHTTSLLLKSDDVLKLKKGQPLELTVKVTGIKKDVSFTTNISGNFTMLSVVQEEEHSDSDDRKQTKFSFFFPLSTQSAQESITITTTVNGITSTDVVGVRFEN